ncbi:MAG: VWA domain-containing protein, partial [Promicromonosporaceae bacterium]|nr:VWA domain-containing protein [Promicromonosporaceae bacterium]
MKHHGKSKRLFRPLHRRIMAAVTALAVISGGGVAAHAAAGPDEGDGPYVATVDGVPVDQATLDELLSQAAPELPADDPAESPADEADGQDGADDGAEAYVPAEPEPAVGEEAKEPAEEPAAQGPAKYTTGAPAPPATEPAVVEIEPYAGTTSIHVRVAGDRTNTGNTLAVTPVEGVVLGLFRSASGGDPVHTATSGPDGIARFDGLDHGTFYFVRGVSAPDGWNLNPRMATAPLTSDPAEVTGRDYAFRVPESGDLAANTTYTSGAQFMRNRTNTGTTAARFESSTGYFAVSRDNPPLPTVCRALNIALIIDHSASINTAALQQTVRDAATTFINTLDGSQLSMEIFGFGTVASSLTGGQSLSLATQAQQLRNAVAGLTAGSFSGQFTNWDDALWQARMRSGAFDIAIVFTDGLPTVFGNPASTTATGSGLTRFTETERSIFAANTLKTEGTHIIPVGIGPIVGQAAASVPNLAAIGSPDAVITGGWADAAEALR